MNYLLANLVIYGDHTKRTMLSTRSIISVCKENYGELDAGSLLSSDVKTYYESVGFPTAEIAIGMT